jgi:hypothetical protein
MFSLVNQAVAQVEVSTPQLGNVNTLADIFALAMNITLGVGVSLTVIFLILGGIQYITAKGDQKAAQEARTSLTNAVIGFIIVVGAFTIKNIVGNIINLEGNIQDNENVIPFEL